MEVDSSVPREISLYEEPPTQTLSLDELENVCLQRILLLKKLEFLDQSAENENETIE